MNPQPRYQPGDKIGGRYQVHQVKMGGMGEVYLCLDLTQNYPMALKTFQRRYQSATLRQAFEQEVTTWVALEKHPNIVRCFWMQTFNNQPFVAMEWIAGEEGRGADLRGWLRYGPLELQPALEIAIDICRGLSHAQEKQPGLVHRDLKPENILIAQGQLAKITDFGLAEIVRAGELNGEAPAGETDGRQSLMAGPGIAGTPPYMAPEQWRGETLDVRTDIYALGCILYEMLTGDRPFQVDVSPTIPQQAKPWLSAWKASHENGPRPTLSATYPKRLNDLLQSCLAKTLTGRPANLVDLLDALTGLYQRQFDRSPPARPGPGDFTTTEYNDRGVTYQALKLYDQALADYDRALELDHNYVPTYNNRGNVFIELDQYERALTEFNQALALDPDSVIAYNGRGNAYQGLQQYDQALADYDRALDLNPNFATAYYNRGYTYQVLGQYEPALIDYNRALELDPGQARAYSSRGVVYYERQEYELALADHQQAVAMEPHNPIYLTCRGNAYHMLGAYEKGIADHSRAIALEPKNAVLYYNRGNIYLEIEHYEAAIHDFSQAIQYEPGDAENYNKRGLAHFGSGNYQAAAQDYSQAIERAPTEVHYWVNRALAWERLKAFQLAIDDYTKAIQLAPADDANYNRRGQLYYDLARNDEALADYQQAINLDPKRANYYYNRGNTYCRLGNLEAALADFQKTIELNPSDGEAYLNIGVLIFERGNLPQALHYFEQAGALGDPKGWPYAQQLRQQLQASAEASSQTRQIKEKSPMSKAMKHYEKGLKHYQAGQPQKAIAAFTKAIEQDPTFAEAFSDRGAVYRLLEKQQKALKDLKRALELNPNLAPAHFNLGALLGKQGKYRQAIGYLDEAIRLGFAHAKPLALQARRDLFLQAREDERMATAIESFLDATSPDELYQAARQYPFMVLPEFTESLSASLRPSLPEKEWPLLDERLAVLRRLGETLS